MFKELARSLYIVRLKDAVKNNDIKFIEKYFEKYGDKLTEMRVHGYYYNIGNYPYSLFLIILKECVNNNAIDVFKVLCNNKPDYIKQILDSDLDNSYNDYTSIITNSIIFGSINILEYVYNTFDIDIHINREMYLTRAIQHDKLDIVSWMINYCKCDYKIFIYNNIDKWDTLKHTATLDYIDNLCDQDIIDEIALFNIHKDDELLLRKAVSSCNLEHIKSLVKLGADVHIYDSRNTYYENMFYNDNHYNKKHNKIIQYLLDQGVDNIELIFTLIENYINDEKISTDFIISIINKYFDKISTDRKNVQRLFGIVSSYSNKGSGNGCSIIDYLIIELSSKSNIE